MRQRTWLTLGWREDDGDAQNWEWSGWGQVGRRGSACAPNLIYKNAKLGGSETYRMVSLGALGMEGVCVCLVVRFSVPGSANRLNWRWEGHYLVRFYFRGHWRCRVKVWANLRYMPGCIYWCPKVFCRMRFGGQSQPVACKIPLHLPPGMDFCKKTGWW